MVLIHFTTEQFLNFGLSLTGFGDPRIARMSSKPKLTRFRDAYGTWPIVCSKIFDDIQTTNIDAARIEEPRHDYFLIALSWLKNYETESSMASRYDLDEQTIRIYVKKYVSAIRELKASKIVWQDLATLPEIIPLTVDGIHCRIQEQHMEPSRLYKSFKLNVPAYAYELAILIYQQKVVWVRGPYKGATRDIDIFNEQDGLQSLIPAGKKVLADKGYPGVYDKVSMKNKRIDSSAVYEFKNRSLAEMFNGRLKNYKILYETFRHRLSFHQVVFEAICVIVQYEMDNGHPLFEVWSYLVSINCFLAAW